MNTVDVAKDDWRAIVFGTVLHKNSLLNDLLNDSTWPSIRLELCNDLYQSNWPERFTDERIKFLRDRAESQGQLDKFYREYRNLPIALENQAIKKHHFKYYEDRYTEKQLNESQDFESVILMDPAKTQNAGSANTAIVGVSINLKTQELLVRDVVIGKMSPDGLYDETAAMAQRINAIVIAPEVTSLHEYITHPLQDYFSRKGLYYEIIEVKPRQGKTGMKRSGGLVPMYRQGLIYHNRIACSLLEERLLQWPQPEKWDEIDALAGIIFVMEEGERYFDREEAPEEIEKEYEQLQNEPALEMEDEFGFDLELDFI